MPRTLSEIFWIQAKSQSAWANLQHCSDRNDAIAAFERYAAQDRFDEVRLIRAAKRKRRQLFEALMVVREGRLLSKAETDHATSYLYGDQSDVDRVNQMLFLGIVFLVAIGAGAALAHYAPSADQHVLDLVRRLAG